jgi:radical SAM/Cys-rich protein
MAEVNDKRMSFAEAVGSVDAGILQFVKLQTLQINLGNRCNQSCRHCHVQAGPMGTKIMTRETMAKVLSFLDRHGELTADITGGCPELNPDFSFFAAGLVQRCERLIARTNLSVFFEDGLDWVPKWYRDNGVVIIASLPCYTNVNVDAQRGGGVFDKSIRAIRMLNDLGYGCNEGLELNLVYNPGGEFLPGPQEELEANYKKTLLGEHGVRFNNLFTITNAPIGRFKQYLEANGKLGEYLELLARSFNPEAAKQIMCRTLLSVDWRGVIYNCDFNQARDMAIIGADGKALTIDSIEEIAGKQMEIVTGEHCFCCTAGAGSSCSGSLVHGLGVG